MEIYNVNSGLIDNESVIALGNFDGLHIAHTKIIRTGIEYARIHSIKSGVLLFEEHSSLVTKNKETPIITPYEEKLELISEMGADFVYKCKFTKELMHLSPEEFIKKLKSKCNIKAVCCGYDYRFGYKASGDTEKLKELGEKYGFEVLVTDAVKLDGVIVSSTAVREMIASGDTEGAARFLGRRFYMTGQVMRGKQNGRRMGFPTANLSYSPNAAVPADGVYAGITEYKGHKYKSVINIGENPTFNGTSRTIESHMLDFDSDIYGESIRIYFIKRLRGCVKFNTVSELVEQIKRDIQSAEKLNPNCGKEE